MNDALSNPTIRHIECDVASPLQAEAKPLAGVAPRPLQRLTRLSSDCLGTDDDCELLRGAAQLRGIYAYLESGRDIESLRRSATEPEFLQQVGPEGAPGGIHWFIPRRGLL